MITPLAHSHMAACGIRPNLPSAARSGKYPAVHGSAAAKHAVQRGQSCEHSRNRCPLLHAVPLWNSKPGDPVPPQLRCPLLGRVMEEPVTAADGFTYERAAIEEHLAAGRCESPVTGRTLHHQYLVQNQALRSWVREWRDAGGVDVPVPLIQVSSVAATIAVAWGGLCDWVQGLLRPSRHELRGGLKGGVRSACQVRAACQATCCPPAPPVDVMAGGPRWMSWQVAGSPPF
jgi:hypothetical protein